ncbi:hypothetical protein V5799_004372 [Amblyomma americanum]|uniref:Uncharacterized protein n=1 Tax=Amblyomma americanum TaxID=6943 RepID=A0AAQ4D6A8_AMBAM
MPLDIQPELYGQPGLLGADVLLAVATPDDGTGVRFAIQREKLQGVLSAACLQWTPSTFDVTRVSVRQHCSQH